MFRRDKNINSHLRGRSSPDSPSEGYIKRDLPLCADTFVQPGFHSATTFICTLTFIVQLEKCSPEPTRGLVFLDTVLDKTYRGTGNRIHGACQEMLESQSTSLGGLVTLWGLKNHAARTGLWIASLLQSPVAAAGSAASPVRMKTKVSDVRRTTSPRQVSTFSPGKYRFLGLMPKAEISY